MVKSHSWISIVLRSITLGVIGTGTPQEVIIAYINTSP